MLCVTTPSIDGRAVVSYRGIVAGEVIFGANVIRDILAEFSDALGGRSHQYEQVFGDARAKALEILSQKAAALEANAVVGIRFDYTVLGAQNGMMMVAATGTAVQLRKSDAEIEKDRRRADEEKAAYFVRLGEADKGPFSIDQLRQLLAGGRIDEDCLVRSEAGKETALADLLNPGSIR